MNLEVKFAEQKIGGQSNPVSKPSQPRVVTLAFLSNQLPAPMMTGRLAASLFQETGSSVVLVRLQAFNDAPAVCATFDDNATVVDWAPADSVLQRQFHGCNLAKTEEGFDLMTFDLRSNRLFSPGIASLISQLKRHFHYVLIEGVADGAVRPLLPEFLRHADASYLFLRPENEDVDSLNEVTEALRKNSSNNNIHCKAVVVMEQQSSQNDSFDRLLARAEVPIERFIHNCPGMLARTRNGLPVEQTNPFNADLRRLAREIGGRLLGLALSSGAAKGFAHIGVIQVLEENGIEIDVVAGASIGAYIGALWTFGHDGKELERLARELEGRWGLWNLIDPVFPPRQGFLRGFALRKRLMRSIGQARFADLLKPLRVVAGNLGTLDQVTFASGEIAPAVHASMAVPGICVPVKIEGESYIDGGIVDPVPVNVLRDMGVSRIIAVNVIPTPERMRLGFEAERVLERQKDTRLRKLFRRMLPLNKQLNYFAPGNLFEILARSIHGAQIRLADASCRLADLVLRPDICDDRWLDCRDPGRFIALGRQAAEAQLEQIKALARETESNDEREVARGTMAAVA
jgi:NTE family protein